MGTYKGTLIIARRHPKLLTVGCPKRPCSTNADVAWSPVVPHGYWALVATCKHDQHFICRWFARRGNGRAKFCVSNKCEQLQELVWPGRPRLPTGTGHSPKLVHSWRSRAMPGSRLSQRTHRSNGKQCKSRRGLVAHGFPWVLGTRRCVRCGTGVAWSPTVSRGYWALAAARQACDLGTPMQSSVCPIYLSTCRSRCGLVARGCPRVLGTRRFAWCGTVGINE